MEFPALMLAALLTAFPTLQPPATREWPTIGPSFVIELTALLFLGPAAALVVALAGTLVRGLIDPQSARHPWRVLSRGSASLLSLVAAGWIHLTLGGTIGSFAWPWQALPIGAAIAVYCLVTALVRDVAVPLFSRRPIERAFVRRAWQACPAHLIGAALAVALTAVLSHGAWELLAVAAVPLYFVGRFHRDYMVRVEHDERQREVIDAVTQGMCTVDTTGHIILWNDALERILGCPRPRALGRPLRSALPGLADAELSRTVADVLATHTPRTLTHVGVAHGERSRVYEVRIVPVDGGATLLWRDVSDQAQAEQAVKRREERLALAAEGASDGLWEWDLRSQEFFVSSRWRSILGLPAGDDTVTAEAWFARVHPDDLPALHEAIEVHLAGTTAHLEHQHRIRHEDGAYRSVLCRGLAARRANGRRPARLAGSLTDVTDRTVTQERLRNAVFLDPLTGLSNRAVFVEGLGRRLAEFKQRRSGDKFAVLYLDLDRFKVVNDSLGHLVGDELLIAVSRRLESCLRQGDALSRLGGDEFAILLNGLQTEQQANTIAFRVQEALSAPFLIGGREVFTSASIGIAFGLAQYANPDEIMHDADTAMYHAKARGKARHEVFDADMHARVRDRLGLENDLRHAVSSNDFEMHYQPIVSLATGMCVGFESLVRWSRNGEPISPATFIPIAEELGLIDPLGTWVMQQACHTFAAWQRRYPHAGLECITVNASSRQLMQQNFLSVVEQAVHESGLKPCDLRIEITETALMDSPTDAAQVLSQLRNFGVKIYLDDFGTGYSSLSHLHKLPVDALKIDRSFVRSLLLPDRPAIVESILALARTLNTNVVAEGIETEVQARELERLGCTHAQGYLFSRPVSTAAVEEILKAHQPLGPRKVAAADAAADDLALTFSSAPFEWPAHIPTGRPT